MSNNTQKKKHQKKSTKSLNFKKLSYTVEPAKIKKDYFWKVLENEKKIINVYEFEEDAQKLADFQNENQVWRIGVSGIPSYLCISHFSEIKKSDFSYGDVKR